MHFRKRAQGLVLLTAVTLLLFGLILFSQLLLPSSGQTFPVTGGAGEPESATASRPSTLSPSPVPVVTPSPTPLWPPVIAPVTLSAPSSAPNGYGIVREETRQVNADFASADGLTSVTDKSLSGVTLDLDALTRSISFAEGTPTVVLYHTHGGEGYETSDEGLFRADKDGSAATRNDSVLAVGDTLAEELTALGVHVVHIDDRFDSPSRSGSFKRSRAAVEKVLASLERVDLVLDLHRGTLPCSDGSRIKPTVLVDGKKAAQITLIACCDPSEETCPDWKKKLGLALCVQRKLSGLSPLLSLPVALESQVYNLDMDAPCLMAEIGTDVNTAAEAKRSAVLLAHAIATALSENQSN